MTNEAFSETRNDSCVQKFRLLSLISWINMGLTFSWPFLMEKLFHHFASESKENGCERAYLDTDWNCAMRGLGDPRDALEKLSLLEEEERS